MVERLESLCLGGGGMEGMLIEIEGMVGGINREVGGWMRLLMIISCFGSREPLGISHVG
jgi:hypothetical protein